MSEKCNDVLILLRIGSIGYDMELKTVRRGFNSFVTRLGFDAFFKIYIMQK